MALRALVLVDIQNDYFPGGKMALVGQEEAADNAALLLVAARAADDLVVHVRHEFTIPNPPFFAPGSEGALIHSKVPPLPGEAVVLKHKANSFRDTNLKAILDEAGVREVVVAGSMSHMCIDATARAAADFGYQVTVAHDACATKDLAFNGVASPAAQVHAAFMAALASSYAAVKGTREILGPVD